MPTIVIPEAFMKILGMLMAVAAILLIISIPLTFIVAAWNSAKNKATGGEEEEGDENPVLAGLNKVWWLMALEALVALGLLVAGGAATIYQIMKNLFDGAMQFLKDNTSASIIDYATMVARLQVYDIATRIDHAGSAAMIFFRRG